jgi:fucose 4-O-acetylase-like acetyltransferase
MDTGNQVNRTVGSAHLAAPVSPGSDPDTGHDTSTSMHPIDICGDPGSGGHRYTEIDAIKALGILTVVLIHSVPTPWQELQTPGERWLLAATRFAVPGFLFASGFLYATQLEVPWGVTAGRLRRVLVPYLIASAVAQIRRFLLGGPMSLDTVSYDLLTGSSLNVYYYVFVLFWLILATPVLARLPERLLLLALPVLLALQVADEMAVFHLSTTWSWRNPLRWGAYFLLGWLLRLHYSEWSRWLHISGRWLGATLACLVAAGWIAMAVLAQPVTGLVAWLCTYAMICSIVVFATKPRWRRPTLEWLSNATYPIYLYHYYFIWMAMEALPAWVPTEPLRGGGGVGVFLLSRWAAGMAGSLGLIAVARWCAQSRSRKWLGA